MAGIFHVFKAIVCGYGSSSSMSIVDQLGYMQVKISRLIVEPKEQ